MALLRKLGLGPHPSHQFFDFFKIPILGMILRSKALRRGIQLIMLILAIAVLLDGFFGPQLGPMNLAGVLPWTHWRGLTVIALLFAGNLFCMVCPFMLVRDFGRRWFPAKMDMASFLAKQMAGGVAARSLFVGLRSIQPLEQSMADRLDHPLLFPGSSH